ncbi:LOW QUALITY PROTEIN: hypothetical protein PHMEG_00030136, partial [Phytophthora megakarya]
MRESNQPVLLLAVTLLFRSRSEFDALPHVISSVSVFLDSSVDLPLDNACSLGSIRLLDRIWTSSEGIDLKKSCWTLRKYIRTDKYYRQHLFRSTLIMAVKDFAMIKWFCQKFSDCSKTLSQK